EHGPRLYVFRHTTRSGESVESRRRGDGGADERVLQASLAGGDDSGRGPPPGADHSDAEEVPPVAILLGRFPAPGRVELVSTEILSPNFQRALGFPARRHYNGALLDLEIRRRKTLASSPTSGDDEITQEQFDELLLCLNSDREKA